tara:strand:+ start:330 stop:479 length:150 start_codon:yes stop_codon:yes gene_type:complete
MFKLVLFSYNIDQSASDEKNCKLKIAQEQYQNRQRTNDKNKIEKIAKTK